MKNYFGGWYFKSQSNSQTVAIIPAVHEINGVRTYSIQIITDDNAWSIPFLEGDSTSLKDTMKADQLWHIGNCMFGRRGVYLEIHTPELRVNGSLHFSSLSPVKYDIMGPFAFVPYMECYHSIFSMQHRVDGTLYINETPYIFENSWGYWEGDNGRSFPKEYAWTQSFIELEGGLQGSIMLSIADIPLAVGSFTGILGIVYWKGKEYRFASYLGARLIQKTNGRLLIRQRSLELEVRLLEQKAYLLQAPQNGKMSRRIRESVKGKAFYRLRKNGQTMFAFQTEHASSEYEYKD